MFIINMIMGVHVNGLSPANTVICTISNLKLLLCLGTKVSRYHTYICRKVILASFCSNRDLCNSHSNWDLQTGNAFTDRK